MVFIKVDKIAFSVIILSVLLAVVVLLTVKLRVILAVLLVIQILLVLLVKMENFCMVLLANIVIILSALPV